MCIDIQKIIRWEKGRELLKNTVQIESHEFIKCWMCQLWNANVHAKDTFNRETVNQVIWESLGLSVKYIPLI